MRANPGQTALYVVGGNKFMHVASDGTTREIGLLASRNGFVDMKFGTTQLVIVDGANGYVYDTLADTLTRITAPGWRGSNRVGYVKGSFLFADPATGVFYISALEDAASLDELQFATASSSPDDILAAVDNHQEAWLVGQVSTDVWSYTGTTGDVFPLEQNAGAVMEVGTLGAFTVQTLDGALFWLGRTPEGSGKVYRAAGYTPQPISNDALEQRIADAIEAGENMNDAIAFTYADRGHGFYWLQVPGLSTTWVFDTKSGQWHERSDFRLGEHVQHRAKHHAYCYGKHIVGGDDGKLYVLDRNANTNAGDPLARDRISPHYAKPTLQKSVFGPFELDCIVGKGRPGGAEARVMMRYSDDGGTSWSRWRTTTLGRIGETQAKALWTRNGSAFDRVWHVRCLDDVAFGIVSAAVQGQ